MRRCKCKKNSKDQERENRRGMSRQTALKCSKTIEVKNTLSLNSNKSASTKLTDKENSFTKIDQKYSNESRKTRNQALQNTM